jgi:ubiquinone/menaquinone biosynthesis C-methylase UbiE
MKIDDPNAYRNATELEVIRETLPIQGADVLELGCGRAWMTRQIAEQLGLRRLIATEVDRIQHEKNLLIDDLPQVTFVYGGAEAIDLPDGSMDIALMLKSLHHVPVELMEQGLREIARVLRPDGMAYISEPVYKGDFNAILSLFHDEKTVREAAFAALQKVVDDGIFELAGQHFFNAPRDYRDFADFEARILQVTHTRHEIGAALYQRIKTAFETHMTDAGAHFLTPSRVDLLRVGKQNIS